MKQRVLAFGKKGIIKNLFHNCKWWINTDEVDVKIIVLSSKELYGKKKSLNIMLDLNEWAFYIFWY